MSQHVLGEQCGTEGRESAATIGNRPVRTLYFITDRRADSDPARHILQGETACMATRATICRTVGCRFCLPWRGCLRLTRLTMRPHLQKGRRYNALTRRTNRYLSIFLWMFSLGWLTLLVCMSSQDGPTTLSTSMVLARFAMRLFGIAAAKLSQVNQMLRTLAHFIGFLILGGAVYLSVRVTWPCQRHLTVAAVVLCSVVAVLDELKKVFINGRHLSWAEAGLNVLGVICGVALSLGIRRLWGAARKTHGWATKKRD